MHGCGGRECIRNPVTTQIVKREKVEDVQMYMCTPQVKQEHFQLDTVQNSVKEKSIMAKGWLGLEITPSFKSKYNPDYFYSRRWELWLYRGIVGFGYKLPLQKKALPFRDYKTGYRIKNKIYRNWGDIYFGIFINIHHILCKLFNLYDSK